MDYRSPESQSPLPTFATSPPGFLHVLCSHVLYEMLGPLPLRGWNWIRVLITVCVFGLGKDIWASLPEELEGRSCWGAWWERFLDLWEENEARRHSLPLFQFGYFCDTYVTGSLAAILGPSSWECTSKHVCVSL